MNKSKDYLSVADVIPYCLSSSPFTVSKDAPADIILAAKSVNAEYLSINAKPCFHFEDESLNDDDKLDYSKPIVRV